MFICDVSPLGVDISPDVIGPRREDAAVSRAPVPFESAHTAHGMQIVSHNARRLLLVGVSYRVLRAHDVPTCEVRA